MVVVEVEALWVGCELSTHTETRLGPELSVCLTRLVTHRQWPPETTRARIG